MATRFFSYDPDMTPVSLAVDLVQNFEEDMELLYPEIEVFQRDQVTVSLTVTQNGQPFNLNGLSVYWNGTAAIGNPTLQFTEQGTVTNAAAGQCSVTLTAQDTATAGTYPSQFYLVGPPGLTQTIMQIPLVVQPSV